MKKKWVELKKGIIIEANSIRSVSAGDTQESMDTTKYLYLGFVGERKRTTFTFDSKDEKWEAYNRIRLALIGDEE
jgi:hypothetical protein